MSRGAIAKAVDTTVKPAAPAHLWYVRIFALCLVGFLASPGQRHLTDSEYSFLVSESILHHHTASLNGYTIPGLDPDSLPAHPNLLTLRPFYQLVRINGKILYSYPPGTPMLSLPFVAALNLLGLRAADGAGVFSPDREFLMQKMVASMLMAALACIFMATARILLPVRASLAITLIAAFGTPIWSSASRTMWSNTWEIVLAGLAILLLLLAAEDRDRLHPVILATLMAWSCFVRPNNAVAVLCVTAYVIYADRRSFLAYAATGGVWLACFLVYWRMTVGQYLPAYFRLGSSIHLCALGAGLAGVFFSPSRGLFIFVPVAIIPIYLVIRHWRDLPHQPLAIMAAAIVVANILLVASWLSWWGGWSFGPRLLTDTIPWFVLLTILGWKGRENYHLLIPSEVPRRSADRTLVAVTAILAAVSIAINGWGSISQQPLLWNYRMDVDRHPERLWDWRAPQFLAGLIDEPVPPPASPK